MTDVLPPPPGRLPWWLFGAVALLALIVYLPALGGPFVFDDLDLDPLQDGATKGLTSYLKGIRPLFYSSLYIEHQIHGANAMPFHVTNLLLHLASAWLLFCILRRLTGRGGLADKARDTLSFFGAAVFLLHPINTEAVSYISSRSEALSVFFGFAAYALFLRTREAGVSVLQAISILALLALAAGAKEHVFALVPLMILTDLFFDGFSGLKRNAKLHAPVVVLGSAAALYVLRTTGGASAGFSFAGGSPVTYFATECRAIWHYLRLFVIPWPQNLDHYYEWSKSLFDPLSLLGLAALIASIALAIMKRKQAPLAAFGWLAFLVLMAPTSSIIPIADALVERRLYLSMIGLLLIAIQILSRRNIPTASLAGVAIVLALMTYNRNGAYVDPVAMWTDSVAVNANNPRAHFHLAQLLHLRGNCKDAEPHFAKAASLGMTTTPLLVDWGLTLDCLGRPDDAIKTLKRAEMQDGAHFALANIAMVEGKRGNYDAALAAVDRSIALNAAFDMAWVYRGNIMFATGRKQEAAEAYRKALELNPKNTDAQRMLTLAAAP